MIFGWQLGIGTLGHGYRGAPDDPPLGTVTTSLDDHVLQRLDPIAN